MAHTNVVKTKSWLESNVYSSRVERAKAMAEEGWQYFYNNVAVLKETKEYLEELQKAMPNVEFIPYDDEHVNYQKSDENGNLMPIRGYIIKSFLAHMKGYPFALGTVSYGDHAVDRSSDLTYGVYSRKIVNPKYAYHRDQHHMQMTKDLKKAIKLAKTFLVPYTTTELATAMYDEIHDNVGKELDRTRRQMRSTLDPIMNNHDIIITELLNLFRQRPEFATPEFKEIAKCLQDRVEIYTEQASRNVSALFVRVYNIGEDTYVDMQEALNVRKTAWGKDALKGTQVTTCLLSELPEDVTHNIAALNILNDNQYVTNVGMKLDDSHFWVERG